MDKTIHLILGHFIETVFRKMIKLKKSLIFLQFFDPQKHYFYLPNQLSNQ
jgi:hypothetical protein